MVIGLAAERERLQMRYAWRLRGWMPNGAGFALSNQNLLNYGFLTCASMARLPASVEVAERQPEPDGKLPVSLLTDPAAFDGAKCRTGL